MKCMKRNASGLKQSRCRLETSEGQKQARRYRKIIESFEKSKSQSEEFGEMDMTNQTYSEKTRQNGHNHQNFTGGEKNKSKKSKYASPYTSQLSKSDGFDNMAGLMSQTFNSFLNSHESKGYLTNSQTSPKYLMETHNFHKSKRTISSNGLSGMVSGVIDKSNGDRLSVFTNKSKLTNKKTAKSKLNIKFCNIRTMSGPNGTPRPNTKKLGQKKMKDYQLKIAHAPGTNTPLTANPKISKINVSHAKSVSWSPRNELGKQIVKDGETGFGCNNSNGTNPSPRSNQPTVSRNHNYSNRSVSYQLVERQEDGSDHEICYGETSHQYNYYETDGAADFISNDSSDIISNIKNLTEEKLALQHEIDCIDSLKAEQSKNIKNILGEDCLLQNQFIKRFLAACRRKREGLINPNCDFEIQLKLIEQEILSNQDPIIQQLNYPEVFSNFLYFDDIPYIPEYLKSPKTNLKNSNSDEITKGLIDVINKDINEMKQSSDQHHYSRDKHEILRELITNHYSPTEYDFLFPIIEEVTQDEILI